MCWSQTSSGSFALLGAILSADQFRRFYKLYSTNQVGATRFFSQFLLYLTYTLMELLQYIQYRVGLEALDGSEGRCVQSLMESPNVFFSVVAHFLVWIQPVVHNYYILHNTKKGKLAFKMTLTLSWMTLILATVSLYMGYNNLMGMNSDLPANHMEGNITPVQPVYQFGVQIHNAHAKLCSYQGPNHLFWMFNYHPMWGYSHNWYVWFIITVIPHLFRRSIGHRDFMGNNWTLGLSVFGGWLTAVLVTVNVGGLAHEIPSYWCLISLPFLVLPYIFGFIRPSRFNFDESQYAPKKKVE